MIQYLLCQFILHNRTDWIKSLSLLSIESDLVRWLHSDYLADNFAMRKVRKITCMLRGVWGYRVGGSSPALHVFLLNAHIEWVDLLQDILLGLLKKKFSSPAKATEGRSLPLKVVVMSATLETEKLSAFLGGCPVFTIPGRTFPVTCTFGSAVGPKDMESTVYVKEVKSFNSLLDV